MRKILLDTETTGLDFQSDRIWEIACIEFVEYEETGNFFHYYLNPQKLLSEEAAAITNMENTFLLDKPLFSSIAQEFLNFIEGGTIVAHNATFDVQMINAELKRCNLKPLTNNVIDTLKLARELYPRGNNTLDKLCDKFKVNPDRSYHGALKDARDLASVYYYLMNAYGKSRINSTLNNQNTIENVIVEKSSMIFSRINLSFVNKEDMQSHIEYCKINGIQE